MKNLIVDENDPRLEAFHKIREGRLAKEHGLFVVEGEYLVQRLLESQLPVQSILVTPNRSSRFEFAELHCESYWIAEQSVVEKIVGFKFHRGIMALAQIPELIHFKSWVASGPLADRLLILPEINNAENLGAILRNAAAFGFETVLFGEKCMTPWVRRVVRTSMGAVFNLQLVQSGQLEQDLAFLAGQGEFDLVASFIDKDSVPLAKVRVKEKFALLLGTEADGLEQNYLEQCHHRVMIPITHRVDSLNVAVASGVIMYELNRNRENP